MTEAPSAGKTAGSLNDPYPTPNSSIGQMILDRVAESGSGEAFRSPAGGGTWNSFTWQQTYDSAAAAGAGLVALGLEPEQRVSIASSTRYEWILSDYAIMLSGGATTTVYPTTGEEDVAYILGDSGSRILIAENQSQADKALNQPDGALPDLETIVLIDGEGNGDNVISWGDLQEKGRQALEANPNLIKERVDGTAPDSLSTLIYTSGTTGKPKGVELTHGNWAYEGAAVDGLGLLRPDDLMYLWLPLAHSFGKVMVCAQLQGNFVMAVDGRVPEIMANMPVVQPTLMPAVPRIFEKINAGVVAKTKADGGMKLKIFNWAFKVGGEAFDKEKAGETVGGWLGFKLKYADKLVFSKVREATGGRMRYFISGSAALAPDIHKFFDILKLPIQEGYGLTETSAATTINRPGNTKAGTVGEPLPGSEVKIAPDGEILIRGPGVMRGYRNRPDANEEVFGVEEGWFATGDIGEIDEASRVKITDRKKDLVKTSGGKYIAPGQIEALFKANCSVAGAAVIIANNRKFASALVALDPDAAQAWADANGVSDGSIANIYNNPELVAEIQSDVDTLNSELNHWETLKQFRVLPKELTVDGGELTPSLKVKRKVVEDEYADLIDSMYA
jgi:long-chain acyl-CoA synthetase